ncbi:MAG: hypothetical protein AB7L92_02015 [Alphaproteobacteria bacterium]
MMRCDAEWLGRVLQQYSVEELSPIVNIGSSTHHFRTTVQPFIQDLIFAPLQARGVQVIHSDIKEGEGVDISCDIFDDAGLSTLKALNPKALICTHMFEHVTDRELLATRLLSLLPVGGLFFITVPMSYHYHADPIDTMYRPNPDELAALFSGNTILQKEVLVGGNYWSHVRKRPVTLFSRHFFRFFFPFLGWEKWKRSMRKLYWLFNDYKVSALAGRKV